MSAKNVPSRAARIASRMAVLAMRQPAAFFLQSKIANLKSKMGKLDRFPGIRDNNLLFKKSGGWGANRARHPQGGRSRRFTLKAKPKQRGVLLWKLGYIETE